MPAPKAVKAASKPSSVVPKTPSVVPPKPPSIAPKAPSAVVAPVSALRPAALPSFVRPANGMNGLVPIPMTLPNGTKLVFKVGDKAVHPSHGLGEIVSIEHRELGGTKGMFYILKILDNGMKVMIPVDGALQAGLRNVMSSKEAEAVLETMRAREVAVDVQPWSRRFRAYTEMIKSGSPHEIAKVLRDMHRLKFDKDLSFGERRLLDQAKSLLMKELALAKKISEQKMAEQIAGIFQT
jgi:CarD family transcriptional regulator